MKRTAELQPLSRDHHQGLTAAQQLRRAHDPNTAGREFLDFWQSHGRRHFQIEEEILLPGWFEADATADAALADRLAREHLEIRTAVRRIEHGGLPLEDLVQLGELLDGHIRFEERELFPRIEAGLEQGALAKLGTEVQAAESAAT